MELEVCSWRVSHERNRVSKPGLVPHEQIDKAIGGKQSRDRLVVRLERPLPCQQICST